MPSQEGFSCPSATLVKKNPPQPVLHGPRRQPPDPLRAHALRHHPAHPVQPHEQERRGLWAGDGDGGGPSGPDGQARMEAAAHAAAAAHTAGNGIAAAVQYHGAEPVE